MKYINFKFFVFLCFTASMAFALPSKDVQDSLDTQIENMTSRRGFEFGGTVRSVMLRSAFSSEQDINAYDKSPDTERSGFSQLDLRLGVRPYDAIGAVAIMRFSAEYQDYFDFGHKSITVPWVSMGGLLWEKFYWVVGDFRTSYSPLSIYSPDVEVLYEPQIFARNRYMARDQMFLQGNDRNLQGANLQFRNDFGGVWGELRAEFIFSRLRRIEVLDSTGYMGNILPSEPRTPGASQASAMDKMLYSANIEWLPFNKNIFVGITPIFIKDIATSKIQVYRRAPSAQLVEINPGVLGPENTQVFAGRAGADLSGFLNNQNLIANLTVEGAMSMDKHYLPDGSSEDLSGLAILGNLVAGWKNGDAWMAKVDAKFMMNEQDWYNPLAQSPAFLARRIMNSDKDADYLKRGSKSPFYTTFDALYHFIPKFSPVAKGLRPSDFQPSDQTKSYDIAPFVKNSYNSAVYTRDELAILQTLTDPILQGSLPNGLASANRVGPKANVILGYGKDNVFELQGTVSMLKESEAADGVNVAEFTEFGGGGKFDFGTFFWDMPLELSGSAILATAKRGGAEFSSSFINGGLHARYFKRFGVSTGIQMVTTTNETGYNAGYPQSGEQLSWMAGLDYTLAKNAWVAINYGQTNVTNKYAGDARYWMPTYLATGIDRGIINMNGNLVEHKFTQEMVEASINVSF